MYSLEKLPIKDWAEEDRPREKLILKGKAALSEAELIAVLIGSGNAKLSAVGLAKSILASTKNDLNELATLSLSELKKFKGIGSAKAISIISALELGRRRKESAPVEKPKISSSVEIYNLLKPNMLDLDHEQFWVVYLNRGHRVLKQELISSGGISGTLVDARLIFKKALELLSCAVILAHNHPSGNCTPSDQDLKLTRKLKEAGKILDIPVLDHIIFTNDGYFSFSDESIL